MALRAHQQLTNVLVRTYKVGTAVTKGKLVKFVTDDDHVTDAAAGEQGIAVALETKSTADADVQVAMLAGAGIIPVLVGTGGATRGSYASAVADGLSNQAVGGGTVAKHIAGIFTQSGVAGDVVGLLPCPMVTATV
jgi:hypothetical protein